MLFSPGQSAIGNENITEYRYPWFPVQTEHVEQNLTAPAGAHGIWHPVDGVRDGYAQWYVSSLCNPLIISSLRWKLLYNMIYKLQWINHVVKVGCAQSLTNLISWYLFCTIQGGFYCNYGWLYGYIYQLNLIVPPPNNQTSPTWITPRPSSHPAHRVEQLLKTLAWFLIGIRRQLAIPIKSHLYCNVPKIVLFLVVINTHRQV